MPAIMDSMGWVLFKRGRREEARGWLEDGLGRGARSGDRRPSG